MIDSSPLPALRALCRPAGPPVPRVALGVAGLDAALGGGLARGRLHEAWPATTGDGPSAQGFALLLAGLVAGADGLGLWITEDAAERRGGLYGPGLVELGLDPARLLLVRAPDRTALLRAGADAVRSPAVAAVVLAPARALADPSTARRLALFAEGSGATAILAQPADPAAPSAATTRWRVAAAPSAALDADAPGHPAWVADVVRQRGGPPSAGWRLEWRRDEQRFAPLPGAGAAVDRGGRVAGGR